MSFSCTVLYIWGLVRKRTIVLLEKQGSRGESSQTSETGRGDYSHRCFMLFTGMVLCQEGTCFLSRVKASPREGFVQWGKCIIVWFVVVFVRGLQ